MSTAYIPTHSDLLHARTPTSGIIEYNFTHHGSKYRMVDVAGQRNARYEDLKENSLIDSFL